jgi:uncharacterized protein (DUF302 family)
MKPLLLAFALTVAALPASAGDDVVTYPYDGSFEDAVFGLETAIVGKGLVIDYVSHVGDMLARTGADVGSEVELFDAADVFLFCSAALSRKMMEADPMNIAHCPYGVFVADRAGEVFIGHKRYPEGAMQEVEALLSDIAQEASAF